MRRLGLLTRGLSGGHRARLGHRSGLGGEARTRSRREYFTEVAGGRLLAY